MPNPSKNHSTSGDYELFVHSLVKQELGGVSGVELLEISQNVAMQGLSGYVHQIDVAYRLKIWLTEILVLVECKQYAKRVGVNDLLEFRSRLDDLRAHKGVFVTSSGYQSGAVEFARSNRIALLVVNATKTLDILYSLSPIPIETQCREQLAHLNRTYSTDLQGTANRISIEPKLGCIEIHHDGVTVQMAPWELHTSMLYVERCSVDDPKRSRIYFVGNRFERLPTSKLLKSLLIDELLILENDG